MLTVNMYNKAGVVSMSIMELSASDKYIARIKEGTQRDAVSQNQQEVITDKTHWDCGKPALSESETFALTEGGIGVVGRVERDVPAWLTILVDSCLLTPSPDSSEGIKA